MISPAPPPTVRRALLRYVLWPSWVFAALLTLVFAAGLSLPEKAQYLPFAASLVLFGLPHGAVDHLVVPRLMGWKPWPWPVLGVALLYAVFAGLYLALWFAAPPTAFVLFVALTWFHWGQGDLYALRVLVPGGASYLGSTTARVLTLIVRGGLPMLVPLLAFPETYRAVALSTAELFGSDVAGISWAFGTPFRLSVGVVFAAIVLGALASGYRRAGPNKTPWKVDAAETLLLASLFGFVPPLLSVGFYFCLWHAPRHVVRLMLLDADSGLCEGRLSSALARFFREAAPLTAVALVLLVGLYFAVPEGVQGLRSLLALYLVLISTLTLPHIVVVTWMDHRQGLWSKETRRVGGVVGR